MARRMGWEIDPLAASCLLVGLTTDTGGFRFSNATPRAFEAAAALVRDGASPARFAVDLREPVRGLGPAPGRAPADALAARSRLRRHRRPDPRNVRSRRRRGRRLRGLVDVPRSIAGVEAVALLREVGDGAFKVSLRSRGAVDVQSIARRYEGGGHRNAAGCRAIGALDELRIRFATELAEAVEASRGV
ncbi:MAG: DHHA1 domain-containing protein [Thermoanaerobaculia bacterium]